MKNAPFPKEGGEGWAQRGSNPRPADYQGAVSGELIEVDFATRTVREAGGAKCMIATAAVSTSLPIRYTPDDVVRQIQISNEDRIEILLTFTLARIGKHLRGKHEQIERLVAHQIKRNR